MNPEQQRIELATLDGWERSKTLREWFKRLPHGGIAMKFPDYLNDLNAVHELEGKLDNIELAEYCELLLRGRHYTAWSDNWIAIHATAAQRCKAILRVKGLWK